MRVKITEKALKSDGFDLQENDERTVEDEIGKRWCKAGWCVDMDGNVPTGERNINPITINPKKINQNQAVQEAK